MRLFFDSRRRSQDIDLDCAFADLVVDYLEDVSVVHGGPSENPRAGAAEGHRSS